MKKLSIIFTIIALLGFSTAFAQDTTSVIEQDTAKIETFVSVDLVSSYVWRGFLLEDRPNIQPIFGLAYKNLELGLFSSKSLSNPFYELDVFLSYTPIKWLNITVTDFYCDYNDYTDTSYQSLNYFEYANSATHHNILVDVILGNVEKFPFTITASTIVYGGYDLDSQGDGKYTTYLELDYYYKDFKFFVGALTGQSDFYLNTAEGVNIVNVGIKHVKNIKVNKELEIPLTTTFGVNPQMEKVYFAISFTF